MNKKLIFSAALLGSLLATPLVWAHGDHRQQVEPILPVAEAPENPTLLEVATSYEIRVRPIFEAKCFDCHSSQTRYPWYYSLPLVKKLIDHDIREAREHMDMSLGFPFEGHGSPVDDLESIIRVTEKGSMPLWRYTLMHSQAQLSDQEKKVILEWAHDSLSKLKN